MILVDDYNKLKSALSPFNWECGVTTFDSVVLEFGNVLEDELYVMEASLWNRLNTTIKEKLNNLQMLVLFFDAESELELPFKEFSGVIFPFSFKVFQSTLSQNILSQLTYLNKSLVEQQILKSELISINHQMNEALTFVGSELYKVKKIHHRQIPKRRTQLQGLVLLSNYLAGNKLGGEFHDLTSSKHTHVVFISRLNSYLATSMLLTRYEELKKGHLDSSSLNNFISNIEFEINNLNLSKKKNITFEYLFLLIDYRKMKMSFRWKGNFEFVSSLGEFNFLQSNREGEHEIDFPISQRILLLSPGFLNNWQEHNRKEIQTYLKIPNLSATDLMDEVFIELKRYKNNDLPNDDATAILMEIEDHGKLHIV